MIIKSYAAESVAAALKAVRAEMGGDAVVLNTRQTNEFGKVGVEITACIDGTTDDKMSEIAPSFDRGIIEKVEQSLEMQNEIPVLQSVEESAGKTEILPTQPVISHQIAVTESSELIEQLSDIQKRLSGIENKLKTINTTLREKTDYDGELTEAIPIMVDDEKGIERECIVIVIKQSERPVGVKVSGGGYEYMVRNGTECISVKPKTIEDSKIGIVQPNVEFLQSIVQFQ